MSPKFRRPRTSVFLVRPRGMGLVTTLPAMQSPLVQSGLYPAPLPAAFPVIAGPAAQIASGGPMTPAGLSTPVLGIPVWLWAAAGGLVYWLFFSGGGGRGRGR